jgi:phosphoglycolate phosphatase
MLIVFDLDGTVVDSARDLADSTNDMLAGYGASPLPTGRVAAMVGDGARKLVARAIEAASLDVSLDEALDRFRAVYDVRLLNHTQPYPGLIDAVTSAAARAPVAMLTNKPERPTLRLLDAFGLLPSFRWVVGGDGAFPRKPDPAGLRDLMARAGSSEAGTLFVGDSTIDAETAHRAGVCLCFARYGFGGLRGPVSLRAGDLVVDDSHELARVIATFLDARETAGRES